MISGDPKMCRPCFDKTHPEIVKAREQHARDWKETQKRIRQESQEKFRMNRAKEIIKIQLYACNRPRRTINQETATVFVWIKNSGKNPLTVKRRTLERMTEEWVRKWRS